MTEQPAEAQVRIQQLTANKAEPTIGGFTLIDGKLRTITRFNDGGVILVAEGGATLPQEEAEPMKIAPAYLSIRPGQPIETLDEDLLEDTDAAERKFFAVGSEWIVWDPGHGMRRLLGNHVAPLLGADERDYAHLVGFDRRGRWLFRKTPQATETLILDPTFPDPVPRLPVWLKTVFEGETGWDDNDWPVLKRGGAWALEAGGWRALNEQKDKVSTEVPAAPASAGVPLLTDADGNRYFDGKRTLHVVSRDGKHTVWPLPPLAMGGWGNAWLVKAPTGQLFLFNQPGRVIRIKPTPGGRQPFAVEATFTHRVPASADVRRVWLDKAGRICMAYDEDKLAVMFPEGRFPRIITELVPAHELQDPPERD